MRKRERERSSIMKHREQPGGVRLKGNWSVINTNMCERAHEYVCSRKYARGAFHNIFRLFNKIRACSVGCARDDDDRNGDDDDDVVDVASSSSSSIRSIESDLSLVCAHEIYKLAARRTR